MLETGRIGGIAGANTGSNGGCEGVTLGASAIAGVVGASVEIVGEIESGVVSTGWTKGGDGV